MINLRFLLCIVMLMTANHVKAGNQNNDEAQFNFIVDKVVEIFTPVARNYGATLMANKNWASDWTGASADQNRNNWVLNANGGLYRHPHMNQDAFALVICHEMGHHMAGYPFRTPNHSRWASIEGNSDYFATSVCLPLLFTSNQAQILENLRFANGPGFYPEADRKCKAYFPSHLPEERGLCIRILYAGKTFADRLYWRHPTIHQVIPQFYTPDTTQVTAMVEHHPTLQCRLDTFTAGAFCGVRLGYETHTIPGKRLNQSSPTLEHLDARKGERVARAFSCFRKNQDIRMPFHALATDVNNPQPWGYRPRCWYKPAE